MTEDIRKALAEARRRFVDEVQDPEIRRLLAASTAVEVGSDGPIADQCYIEAVFNRAAARNMSLEKTLKDSNYYPASTLNRLDSDVASDAQARIDEIIDGVMAGANESNLATGNESGPIHSGGAPVTRDLGPGKVRFVRELPDQRWIRRMESTAAGGDDVA